MADAAASLVEDFRRFFRVEVAHTPEQLAEVFGIRYRVYCEEFAYEPRENFPDGQERDDFDQQSLHCLVTHKASEQAAGCVRLVLCEPGQTLPMEKYCREALDPSCLKALADQRSTACEVSRLAVDGQFRRRAGEDETRFGHINGMDCTAREVRTFSLIAVAAYLSACALTDLTGRTFVHAMMEPFLPRLLRRSGIEFEQAGSEIDYHGLRAPYVTHTESVVGSMRPELRELYQSIRDEFALVPGVAPVDSRWSRPGEASLKSPRAMRFADAVGRRFTGGGIA